MEYIHALGDGGDGCFLCRYRGQADEDAEEPRPLVRGRTLVVINRFPYTGGHC